MEEQRTVATWHERGMRGMKRKGKGGESRRGKMLERRVPLGSHRREASSIQELSVQLSLQGTDHTHSVTDTHSHMYTHTICLSHTHTCTHASGCALN